MDEYHIGGWCIGWSRRCLTFLTRFASTAVGFDLAGMARRPNPEGDPVGFLTDEEPLDGFTVGKPG